MHIFSPVREGISPENAVKEEEEVEPSWELPPDLAEFQGDSMDRKGLLIFRQKQQAARQVHYRSCMQAFFKDFK